MEYRLRLFQSPECRIKLYLAGNIFDSTEEFYRKRLRLIERHRWVNTSSRGVMFELSQNTVLELIDDKRSGQTVSGCGLSLAVEDVWRLYQNLCSMDIPVGLLRDNEWGDTSFPIVDPSGFSIVFYSKTQRVEN